MKNLAQNYTVACKNLVTAFKQANKLISAKGNLSEIEDKFEYNSEQLTLINRIVKKMKESPDFYNIIKTAVFKKVVISEKVTFKISEKKVIPTKIRKVKISDVTPSILFIFNLVTEVHTTAPAVKSEKQLNALQAISLEAYKKRIEVANANRETFDTIISNLSKESVK